MNAGYELNALVAERVMGDTGSDGDWKRYPPYSTSIEAAWQVAEHLAATRGWAFRLEREPQRPDQQWACSVEKLPGNLEWGWADTAPLAICRAALAATEQAAKSPQGAVSGD